MFWSAAAPAAPPPAASKIIESASRTKSLPPAWTDEVKVVRTGCFGLCALGPIMIIYPEGSFY